MTMSEGLMLACTAGTMIATFAATVAAFRSAQAADRSADVANMQKHLAQRQLLLPLWEYMSSIKPIGKIDPSPVDVVRAINTLELVALCCESDVVDEEIIKRTFRQQYMLLFEQVKRTGEMSALGNKTGDDLIRENRAAELFYKKLKNEELESDKPKKLGG